MVVKTERTIFLCLDLHWLIPIYVANGAFKVALLKDITVLWTVCSNLIEKTQELVERRGVQ